MSQTPRFVWADTGSIRMMVHSELPPTDEEWEGFMANTVRQVDGKWVAPERKGALIYSRGGMATPRQRRQMSKIDLTGNLPTLVLMTDSRLARGVATAIGWVTPSLKNFHALPLNQLDEAARLMSAIPSERAEFKVILGRLLDTLDGVGLKAAVAAR